MANKNDEYIPLPEVKGNAVTDEIMRNISLEALRMLSSVRDGAKANDIVRLAVHCHKHGETHPRAIEGKCMTCDGGAFMRNALNQVVYAWVVEEMETHQVPEMPRA